MSSITSAYRFTRHADEYAVTRRHDGTPLGIVRRVGATWTASPATAEQGAHLYVTEHWTRHNAAIALDAAALIAGNEAPVKATAPVTPAAPVESAPAVGDLVRIYSRSRWYDAAGVEQRARTLDEGTWRILRANRHGDWTVQHVDHPGTSHDVFRVDVEHIPADVDATEQEETPAEEPTPAEQAPAVQQNARAVSRTRSSAARSRRVRPRTRIPGVACGSLTCQATRSSRGSLPERCRPANCCTSSTHTCSPRVRPAGRVTVNRSPRIHSYSRPRDMPDSRAASSTDASTGGTSRAAGSG